MRRCQGLAVGIKTRKNKVCRVRRAVGETKTVVVERQILNQMTSKFEDSRCVCVYIHMCVCVFWAYNFACVCVACV